MTSKFMPILMKWESHLYGGQGGFSVFISHGVLEGTRLYCRSDVVREKGGHFLDITYHITHKPKVPVLYWESHVEQILKTHFCKGKIGVVAEKSQANTVNSAT